MLEKLAQNWSLKLLALVISLALWIFVAGQEKVEIGVPVPVEITNLPKDTVVTNNVISQVEVRLYGPRTLVRRMGTERLVKPLNLSGMGAGEHFFQVVPEDLALPPAVRVVRITPPSFRVVLAERVSRQVPVRPVLKGKAPEGLEVGEVTFQPAKVTVSGLKEEVADLDWVWTVPIEADKLSETTSFKVNLRVPTGRAIRLDPAAVEATVKVRPAARPAPAAGKQGEAAPTPRPAADKGAKQP